MTTYARHYKITLLTYAIMDIIFDTGSYSLAKLAA